MKKAVIGISGSITVETDGDMPGYERAYATDDYVQAVAREGAIPVILPIVQDEDIIKEQVKNVDAIILSGGHDVSPLVYGEEPLLKQGEILEKRDYFDIKLLKTALELKKPVLGICRGLQLLNAALGGTNYQDLSYIEGCTIKHDQGSSGPTTVTHTVETKKDSKLNKLFGDTFLVNSFHHQALKEIPQGFVVSAKAKDGVIEGIEKLGEDFVVGVQWHPEMMSVKHENMRVIFKELIKEALK